VEECPVGFEEDSRALGRTKQIPFCSHGIDAQKKEMIVEKIGLQG
jgi:hypothetical protein